MPKKKKSKKKQEKEESKPKVVVKAIYTKERVITEDSDDARELYNKSRYGSLLEDGKVQLSLLEALYLIEKGRLKVLDGRNKEISSESFLKKAQKTEI